MTLRTIAGFDRIGEENAFAVLARANQLAAQGRDIINLGIGQPDFRTPEHIVEAAVKALLDEVGVALIGGPDFGINGEGYIRVSYANSEDNIRKAVERIGGFLVKNT